MSRRNQVSTLSAEQKRALLKKMLRKQSQNTKPAKAPSRSQPIGGEIPARFYRFEHFPEYQKLEQQFKGLEQLQIANPYFKVNDNVVNDRTEIEGQELISYASYNYLGYSGDARVSQVAKKAIDRYGTSVSASRVATGERAIHQELEQELATLLGTEACVVFVSGHATNVTTIGHLFGPKDLILYDVLSHNSILQGCQLSGAKGLAFPHNDWQALEHILREKRHQYERVLIVIEGIYSVDGDIANLPRFIDLRTRYKTLLMVDEAHSIGVLGQRGAGIGEYFGVNRQDVDLWMGTLSKTFASCGGYIAGSKALVTYLKYHAPGFLYSVGMSPANAAAALAVAKLLKKEPEQVTRLQQNAKFFLNLAKKNGLDTGLSHDSPVVPIIIGHSAPCLQLADALFKHGINVQPLLYPIVPEEAARLRFFITSDHTEEQMRYTIETVATQLKQIRQHAVRHFPIQELAR